MNSHATRDDLVRSADEVRRDFAVRGLSIAAWARAHGYSSQLVYRVLAARKPCLRGQSHQIAVRLGLKRGLFGSLLEFVASEGRLAPTTAVDAPQRESKPMA
jgi:gp16 family phage-associated protein